MIKTLEIEGYKGLNEVVKFGKETKISGTNEAGKTRVREAFLWLLTGVDIYDRANYKIKPDHENTATDPEVSCSVTGIFDNDIALKREYGATTKKDGTYKGDTTLYAKSEDGGKHWIEDIMQKDYEEIVKEMFGEKWKIKMLIDPEYFAGKLPWRTRRNIVFEIAGEITDDEVLENLTECKYISDLLKAGEPDEVKKKLKRQARKIEEKMKELKAVKKEKKKDLQEMELPESEAKLRKEVENIEKEIDQLREKKAGIEAGKELHENLQEAENKLMQERKKAAEKTEKKREAYSEKKQEIREELEDMENKKKQKRRIQDRIEDKKEEVQKLRNEYMAEQKKVWEGSTECYACGRDLPEEKIKDAKKKFNSRKVKALKNINITGQSLKAEIEELEKKAEKINVNDEEYSEVLARMKKIEYPEAEEVDEKYEKAVKEAKQALRYEEKSIAAQIEPCNEKISELTEGKEQVLKELARFDEKARIEKRIEELTEEQKAESEVLTETKQQIEEIDKFMKMKVDLNEKQIYRTFGCKFVMYEKRKGTDGYKEKCEVMVEGRNDKEVEFMNASTGKRNKIGILIAEVLQKHYEKELPVFVDNSESIAKRNRPETDMQVVWLTFSENKNLKIEEVS